MLKEICIICERVEYGRFVKNLFGVLGIVGA